MRASAGADAGPFSIDWSKFRLTGLRVFALSALMLGIAVAVSIAQFSAAKHYVLPAGAVVGGDYVAFDVAATAAAEGRASETYDPALFEAMLKEHGPPKKRFGLTWQYPPTYFFLIAPLALLPYAAGYALWTGGTLLAFLGALRLAGASLLALFVFLASPTAFQAAITGQNGFLTAALLLVAALFAERRPLVAGAAAALLTVKPQLGVLLPIAFVAAGCWRAFAAAAVGATALALAATIAYGADVWTAFLSGLGGVSGNLAAAKMPLYKMATPFAALRFAGAPVEAAAVAAVLVAVAAAAAVFFVWRRIKDVELRAAALLALALLAAPYGFYYELTIPAAALALVARRAAARGWLPGEQISLVAMFLLPMALPGNAARGGVSLGFLVVAAALSVVARRVLAEEGARLFTSASAGSRAPAG